MRLSSGYIARFHTWSVFKPAAVAGLLTSSSLPDTRNRYERRRSRRG